MTRSKFSSFDQILSFCEGRAPTAPSGESAKVATLKASHASFDLATPKFSIDLLFQ